MQGMCRYNKENADTPLTGISISDLVPVAGRRFVVLHHFVELHHLPLGAVLFFQLCSGKGINLVKFHKYLSSKFYSS